MEIYFTDENKNCPNSWWAWNLFPFPSSQLFLHLLQGCPALLTPPLSGPFPTFIKGPPYLGKLWKKDSWKAKERIEKAKETQQALHCVNLPLTLQSKKVIWILPANREKWTKWEIVEDLKKKYFSGLGFICKLTCYFLLFGGRMQK